MKRFPLRLLGSALLSLLCAPLAQAQWQNTSVDLKGGWNAIYLHGDAGYTTPDVLFASYPDVLEVWRWNPNPTQAQFTTSPLIPSAGTPEWSTWVRGGSANSLGQMIGQTAYLVKCSGAATSSYSVTIPQKVMPPSATWVRHGANLMGFPSFKNGSTYPTIGAYFATFPAAIASNVKIYKYVGGDLGPGNPLQVFSPSSEKLDRNQAYWFDSKVVGDFYAPVEISLSNSSGIDFGRTGATVTVRLLNRSAAVSTVTLTPVASANAPAGQEAITGSVPLRRRTFDTATGSWTETAIAAAYTEVVGPNAAVELTFGIDRAAMTGSSNAFYASLLRLTDSANLYDILLPVTARKASLAGLWLGEAIVGGVESKTAGYPGTATAQTYPLRYIVHVDDAGKAQVLSQVFLGLLAGATPQLGICTAESRLSVADKASARRIVAAHLPLDRKLDGVAKAGEPAGSGSVALGGSLTRTIITPFNDPTSPFVHQYHPDHDNQSGTTALVSGQESYDLSRAVTFNFAATAPAGVPATGYGASVIAGNYTEVITGLRKDSVTVTGTFSLRRVSEIGVLTP
jgi:hypothetical protein